MYNHYVLPCSARKLKFRLAAIFGVIILGGPRGAPPCQAAYDLSRTGQTLKSLSDTDPMADTSKIKTLVASPLSEALPAAGKFFQFDIASNQQGYPGGQLSFDAPVDFSNYDILAVWFKTSTPLHDFQITVNGADGVIVDLPLSPSAAAPGGIVPADTWTRAYVPYKSSEGWVRFGPKMDFTKIKSLNFYCWSGYLSKQKPLYTFQVGGLQLLSLQEARAQFQRTMTKSPIESAALLSHDKNALVWTADAGEKVLRDTALPKQASRASAATELVAGNEYASLTWVVRPSHDLKNVRAKIGELVCGKQRIAASSITLRYVDYVPGLLFDSPDPLPLLPTKANGKTLDAAAHKNLQVWASIDVPFGTAAGAYTGKVVLDAQSEGRPLTIELPLRLDVRPFSLSRERHLKSVFSINQLYNYVPAWFPEHSKAYWGQEIVPFSPQYKTAMDSVFRDFAHIRMTPELHRTYYGYPTFEERLALHRKYGFDPIFSLAYNLANDYQVVKPGDTSERERIRASLRANAEKLKTVADLTEAKIGDEPTPEFMPYMEMAAEDVKAIAPGIHSFAALTTPDFPKELVGKINTWCMQWDFDFTSPQARQRLKAGDSLWVYGAEYKLNYAYLPMDLRAPYWLYWKWGITGVHHSHHMHAAFLTYPNDTYPHSDGLQEIPSIRWEMIGHGVQDYEYLWLLNDLIKRSGKRGEKYRSLLEVPAALALDQTHYTNIPRILKQRRAAIARAIETLRNS